MKNDLFVCVVDSTSYKGGHFYVNRRCFKRFLFDCELKQYSQRTIIMKNYQLYCTNHTSEICNKRRNGFFVKNHVDFNCENDIMKPS